MTMAEVSFDKSLQIGRDWNKSVARRRRAVAQSDTDSSDAKESASLPPPPDSLIPKPPVLPPTLEKSSSCTCRKSNSSVKRRQGSSSTIQEKSNEKLNRDLSLQQMEAKLYNSELEEAMNSERLERSHRRLHRVAQLVDAQVMFVQSLHLKVRATERLIQLAGNFSDKDLSPSQSLSQTLDNMRWDNGVLERLADVQSVASEYNETPEQLYQLLEEFRDKRKDYRTASNTFGQYLKSTSRISTSLLRKYEAQFDSIRGAYDTSRQALEREFPKLIQERQDVLEHCFSKLVPIQHELIDQDSQFLTLMKEISKCLQEPSKKQSCRHGCGDSRKMHH